MFKLLPLLNLCDEITRSSIFSLLWLFVCQV